MLVVAFVLAELVAGHSAENSGAEVAVAVADAAELPLGAAQYVEPGLLGLASGHAVQLVSARSDEFAAGRVVDEGSD